MPKFLKEVITSSQNNPNWLDELQTQEVEAINIDEIRDAEAFYLAAILPNNISLRKQLLQKSGASEEQIKWLRDFKEQRISYGDPREPDGNRETLANKRCYEVAINPLTMQKMQETQQHVQTLAAKITRLPSFEQLELLTSNTLPQPNSSNISFSDQELETLSNTNSFAHHLLIRTFTPTAQSHEHVKPLAHQALEIIIKEATSLATTLKKSKATNLKEESQKSEQASNYFCNIM